MSSIDSGARALPVGLEVPADLGADPVHGAVDVGDECRERQVGEQFAHRAGQRRSDAIDADRYGSRGPADVGRAEFDFAVDADGAERVACHRIEECAVEIAVGPARDDLFVGRLDLGPERRVRAAVLQLDRDRPDAARDTLFVELDARNAIPLRARPIACHEMQRGAARDAAELVVIRHELFGDRRRKHAGRRHRRAESRGRAHETRAGRDRVGDHRVPDPQATSRFGTAALAVNCSSSVLPLNAPVEHCPAVIAVCTASK